MQEQVHTQPVNAAELARAQAFVNHLQGGNQKVVSAKQLMRAWRKQLRRVYRPAHLTKTGYAVQPTSEPGRWEYKLTSREVELRKSRRHIQKESRRANRAR